jgi:hypothetical protein
MGRRAAEIERREIRHLESFTADRNLAMNTQLKRVAR